MSQNTNTHPGVIMALYEIWRDRMTVKFFDNEDEVARAAFFAGYMAGTAGNDLRKKVLEFAYARRVGQ